MSDAELALNYVIERLEHDEPLLVILKQLRQRMIDNAIHEEALQAYHLDVTLKLMMRCQEKLDDKT